MKIVISTNVLNRKGLNLQDFSVLLYYIAEGRGDIQPAITNKLWEYNYLIKTLDGYIFNSSLSPEIESWFAESCNNSNDETQRYLILADKLRALFPAGRKEGTNYMWRDNTVTIAKKLNTLSKKFEVEFTDDEAVAATQRYIDSFNGNYAYMQLLKYFILKKDLGKQEETSQLLSFMQNEDETVSTNFDRSELI